METENLTLEFFESENWSLVAQSFNPAYSIYEDQDPALHSMVIAQMPNRQDPLFVCEYVYSSDDELLQHQKADLLNALETIESMLR